MKRVEIEEVNNGYWVMIGDRELVYTSLDTLKLLEEIGKYFLGKRIEAKER